MKVLGVRWVGVATARHEEMVAFLRDVLGLSVAFGEPATAELSFPSGDRIQVFGPGHRYFERFGDASGPVPLFEVDDVHAARQELEAAGVELLGEIERDDEWEWIDFRAPDGNAYELASQRRAQ